MGGKAARDSFKASLQKIEDEWDFLWKFLLEIMIDVVFRLIIFYYYETAYLNDGLDFWDYGNLMSACVQCLMVIAQFILAALEQPPTSPGPKAACETAEDNADHDAELGRLYSSKVPRSRID